MIGRRTEQEQLATRAGATEFLTSTPEGGFDLAIEAAGNAVAIETALGLTARGVIVILLDLPGHGATIVVAPDDFVKNDLIVQGSFSYTRSSWAEVVARVNGGDLRPSFLITHMYELSDSLNAVAALRGTDSKEPRGKVAILL